MEQDQDGNNLNFQGLNITPFWLREGRSRLYSTILVIK